MKIFKLPDLGEGLQDADVCEWHVAVGDEVTVDQVLVTVETAKATVEIPSPYSGKVTKLYGDVHDTIQTGDPLVAFDGEDDSAEESTTVVGEIVTGEQVLEESPTGVSMDRVESAGVKATPAVRALAKKLGVGLNFVTPTGPNGSATADDVRKVANQEDTSLKVLRGVRKAMAINMSKAHSQVVPTTLMDDADINHWSEGEDKTLRIIKAVVSACEKEPGLNAHYDHETLTCQLFKEINIGIAVDTVEGLYVPVLKDSSQRESADLRREIEEYKAKAKKQAFTQDDLKGATLHLSNYGVLAGRYSTPVVIPPIVAIIGIGRARKDVVAVDDCAEVHLILPISITFDHRAVTGGETARFLAALISHLEG